MKKILLILFCLYSLTSLSQDFNKYDKLFGGSFSFSVFNINNTGPGYYSTGNVGILPSYSWFIKNNLALGIRGNVSYQTSNHQMATGERTTRSFITGIGVFLKKYKPLKEKFGVSFENELEGNYQVSREKFPSTIYSKTESYGLAYNFTPGVFYRFSHRFMGEGSIGGVYASFYGGEGANSYGIGASFLQYFNLGINYLIEKKENLINPGPFQTIIRGNGKQLLESRDKTIWQAILE